MAEIANFKDYVKKKKHEDYERRKSMVYLRPFNFNNLRYNKKVVKDGVTYTVNATRNPLDPRNLYFDVYKNGYDLVKIFVVTEEENCDVSNLDYHIWNKIDGVYKGNPVVASEEFFEPDENGVVDERDWAKPWLKINEGRYEVVDPEEYRIYLQKVHAMVKDANSKLCTKS